MRTLYIEIEKGEKTLDEEREGKGRGRIVQHRTITLYEVLKVGIPDEATVTLQGMNPANNYKGSGNPVTLRIYGKGKVQLAAIPNVVAFREEGIKVERLVNKPNVIGKVWEDVGEDGIMTEGIAWTPVSPPEEELEF